MLARPRDWSTKPRPRVRGGRPEYIGAGDALPHRSKLRAAAWWDGGGCAAVVGNP